MAERSDITVDWGVSPRIITVAAPSVEVSIQDLHDTLNSNTLPAGMSDDSLNNMDDEPIISSAGKEDLGGGQQVGVTSTLLNAQVAFEARTAELETGAVTTAGILELNDTNALFQTNLVTRGKLVYNITDGSQGTVAKVISETQLIVDGLTGGTTNQFTLTDDYVIYDVVQCNISGGNLVAVDDVDAELDPVFPTFGTQVVKTSSSSATLLNGAPEDVWGFLLTTTFPEGSAGERLQQLLSTANFMALK